MDTPHSQSNSAANVTIVPRQIAPVETNPPLPMQTSNHLTTDRLDIGHGGGGIPTSDTSDTSNSRMKRKCPVVHSEESTSTIYKYARVSGNNQDTEDCSNDEEEDEDYDDIQTLDDGDINGDVRDTTESRPQVEFDILDELEIGGAEEMNSGSHSETDSDIPEEEIEAMLEEGLKSYVKGNSTDGSREGNLAPEVRKKVVLKVRSRDHFDVLPEGWLEVSHNSGMPVYLHKQTRVCSLSKPYFLGPGSARKHEVPISSIPCLHYKKLLEKERLEKEKLEKDKLEEEEEEESKEENSLGEDSQYAEVKADSQGDKDHSKEPENGVNIPTAKVESVHDSKKEGSLDYLALRDYCQKLFEFQTLTVRRFKTWAGRRRHQKIMKQRPTLPDGTKLITCPLPPVRDKGHATGNNAKREFIMNPSGKSFVCVLHEYVQHTMRVQPRYIFKELESPSTPYGATVVINDMKYGSGFGSSKKQAKLAAAKSTLEILIPQMKEVMKEGHKSENQFQDVTFFDEVRVEDLRVSELCAKAGQPQPYQLLLECLRRNYGMGDTEIKLEMRNLKHQKNEFIMTVGKHTASVICKNKRDGKQRASQAILQALHPHITSCGSLLRLYGKGSFYTLKEKKEEEQKITELQSKACANKPNLSILNKLKEEMLKFKAKREALKPIGKFIPKEMKLPSASSSNLKNVEL